MDVAYIVMAYIRHVEGTCMDMASIIMAYVWHVEGTCMDMADGSFRNRLDGIPTGHNYIGP